MTPRSSLFPFVALVGLAGCEGVLPGFDWQQMNDQHKFKPFSACAYFPDGRAMQPPPDGTVPHGAITGRPDLERGIVDGSYVTALPVSLTRERLEAGRAAFDRSCAACHGLDGSGDSEVARNMDLRKPPSLIADPVRGFPVGRIFHVASEGYGLMPSYAIELDTDERWAVTAYVRALQLAASVELASLPDDVRRDAEAALATRGGAP